MKTKIPVLISLLTLILANASQGVTAVNLHKNSLHLISSSEKGISFEVQVPWQDLDLQELSIEESNYTKVSLTGWEVLGQAGAPELPIMIATFAVPFGVEVSLDVNPGNVHTKKLDQPVIPVADQLFEGFDLFNISHRGFSPSQRFVYEMNKDIYSANTAFPGHLAKITNDGILRHQRLVGITIYPVQFNPRSRQLLLYESIMVNINFKGEIPLSTKQSLKDVDIFERIYEKTVVNYKSSWLWRQSVLLSEPDLLTNPNDRQVPWLPPSPGWRVSTIDEGFYKINYLDLVEKNMPVDSLSLSTLKVFNNGSEIAIDVVDNNSNDHFDEEDFIIFYAQALESKYSEKNVYWLTYDQELGMRMQSRDVTPGLLMPLPTIPEYFPTRFHFEENLNYATTIPGPDELERFVWGYIATGYSIKEWSTIFDLPEKSADTSDSLKVALVGYSDDPFIPMEHRAIIKINDVDVGDFSWDGREWYTVDLTLPPGLLLDTNNTIKITSPSTHNDAFYIDWFEIGINQHFVADSDLLSFTYNGIGNWQFAISNFTTGVISAYDISDQANPIRLRGLAYNETAFEVKFDDVVTEAMTYWVGATTNLLRPVEITEDTPSNLWSTTKEVDYLLISHELFEEELSPLVGLRTGQGFLVMQVDVQDIYDEFNYGITSAMAIRDFLAYVWSNWTKPPAIVVLVGDGHYNPKDYNPGSNIWQNYGFGRPSFIPPYLAMVEPVIGETAADNRYVTIVGTDNLPDVLIGRLAVNSESELVAFVNKIVTYEQLPADNDWNMAITLAADNPDSAGSFQFSSEMLRSCCIPSFYNQERIYLGTTHTTAELAKAALIASINSGKLLVNFIGHGAYSEWGGWDNNPILSGDLLSAADIGSLTNLDKYSIVLAMTCAEGMYHHPHPLGSYLEAMAEVITKAENKGAVASWSPTGWGLATGHDLLNRGFFKAALMNNANTIGESTLSGIMNLWSSGSNLDLIDTYLLFGDPATHFLKDVKNLYLPLILR